MYGNSRHLQRIKLGHEIDIFHHPLTVNGNFLQKQVKLLVCHVQLKSSFDGRAELLLGQKSRISAINVTEKKLLNLFKQYATKQGPGEVFYKHFGLEGVCASIRFALTLFQTQICPELPIPCFRADLH